MSSRKLHEPKVNKQKQNKNALFPAGLKFSYTFNDPDEMSDHATKWRVEYFQVTRGRFAGTIQGAHTRSLQIGRETWSSGIFITGDIPEKSVVFAISTIKTEPPVFHNYPLHTTELVMLRDGNEIDFLSKSPQDMLLLSIDRELANRYSVALLGKEIDAIRVNNNRLKVKDRLNQIELRNLWEQTINLIFSSDLNLSDIVFANKIEEEMIRSILSSSAPSDSNPARAERHRAAKQARQCILEKKNKLMSISDICEEVQATERTLHLGFKELYGFTPKTFLKYLRLNHARKDLLQAEPGYTVTTVAYKWQFYHLSRFSRYYYEVFNEYPSETLKRSLAL